MTAAGRDGAQTAPACVLVIFGATGDLTRRLLVPALRNLRRDGLLAENLALIGLASRDIGDAGFRKHLRDGMEQFKAGKGDADIAWFTQRAYYLGGKFEDPGIYKALAGKLAEVEAAHHTAGNVLFYLATPPSEFAVIVEQLGKAGLTRETDGHWRRVIIEKPFGHDLPSAVALNKEILKTLDEGQIYRIDHYLGKETVQNIMVFRFANGFVEPLWNRDHIDNVRITVAETVGVEQRGRFYDQTGALRDMVPNHLFQLLTLIAMEPPSCFGADALRSEKSKVLDAVHRLSAEEARRNVVRGQYGAGIVDNKQVVPYREAPDVPRQSTTETYIAMKLAIDNWRWAGVPFYLRTGKALARRRSYITVQFKQAPLALFRDTPVERLPPNDLTLHIQPDEGVTLRFGVKIPGPTVNIDGVDLKFNYQDAFEIMPSTGYETLVYDCMTGDAALFQRADSIEAGWRVVQPVLDAWKEEGRAELPIYPAGSSGPEEANQLLSRDGRRWRAISTDGLSAGG
ncbi:glucose-6-phosphate dehydrogenase [Reyranella sp.]|uniref:glucose-6-phosphate dehydrogenase n=1 Tax=Reyranella sp. TaxID=1929291 RepID=UPI002F94120D